MEKVEGRCHEDSRVYRDRSGSAWDIVVRRTGRLLCRTKIRAPTENGL